MQNAETYVEKTKSWALTDPVLMIRDYSQQGKDTSFVNYILYTYY